MLFHLNVLLIYLNVQRTTQCVATCVKQSLTCVHLDDGLMTNTGGELTESIQVFFFSFAFL